MGKPRPASVRKKISETKTRQYAEIRAQQGPPAEKKRCTKCREWKPANSNYYTMRTRTYPDGSKRYYPGPRCKPCAAEDRRERMAKLTPEQRKAVRKRSRANRNTKANREYHREWAATKRRKQNVPAKGSRQKETRTWLDPAPLRAWLADREIPRGIPDEIRRRIDAVRAQEDKRLSLATADAIALAFHEPGLLAELYPG